MGDLYSSAWLILAVLFVSVLVIASAEEIYSFTKGLFARQKLPRTSGATASGYIEESLSSGERVVSRFKLHWAARWLLLVWICLLLLPLAIYEWLRLRSIEMGITNKRIILKKGIVGRKTQEMQISSIETVEMNQGAIGRVLGYGSVRITGRGTSDVIFKTIANPLETKIAIENLSAK